MREGTRKLFPTDYEMFKAAMSAAAEKGELPVILRLNDIGDFSLKDIQDTFIEFNLETGLELTGVLELDGISGKLVFSMQVDHPDVTARQCAYLQ